MIIFSQYQSIKGTGFMNRIDRLVAILIHLQSKKVVTAHELGEHFQISVRTVYRDIRALEKTEREESLFKKITQSHFSADIQLSFSGISFDKKIYPNNETINLIKLKIAMTQNTEKNTNQIAYCGLYCGACRSYQKGRCPGCDQNAKAAWCSIRTCNQSNGYRSCADCTEFSNPMACKKYNNFMSRFFGFVFRSDRAACIAMIKEKGYKGFAGYMRDHKLQTIARK